MTHLDQSACRFVEGWVAAHQVERNPPLSRRSSVRFGECARNKLVTQGHHRAKRLATADAAGAARDQNGRKQQFRHKGHHRDEPCRQQDGNARGRASGWAGVLVSVSACRLHLRATESCQRVKSGVVSPLGPTVGAHQSCSCFNPLHFHRSAWPSAKENWPP